MNERIRTPVSTGTCEDEKLILMPIFAPKTPKSGGQEEGGLMKLGQHRRGAAAGRPHRVVGH